MLFCYNSMYNKETDELSCQKDIVHFKMNFVKITLFTSGHHVTTTLTPVLPKEMLSLLFVDFLIYK